MMKWVTNVGPSSTYIQYNGPDKTGHEVIEDYRAKGFVIGEPAPTLSFSKEAMANVGMVGIWEKSEDENDSVDDDMPAWKPLKQVQAEMARNGWESSYE